MVCLTNNQMYCIREHISLICFRHKNITSVLTNNLSSKRESKGKQFCKVYNKNQPNIQFAEEKHFTAVLKHRVACSNTVNVYGFIPWFIEVLISRKKYTQKNTLNRLRHSCSEEYSTVVYLHISVNGISALICCCNTPHS